MSNTGPLAGLKVIELAHIMAGPVCGRMLADMGADVIKVERVPHGDATRGFVPPEIDGESPAFMMLNRNKRGIAVDLKQDSGKEVVRRLLANADILIENYRKGTMERLGLDYASLSADNPGLIYCEISGFGRTGPFADVGGFDLVAQGYSGLMSITGEGPGRPPVKCGAPITDISAGLLGAIGVLAAVIERRTSGKGQRVDTSLFEAGITLTFWQSAIALATGEPPEPLGSAHPLAAPYEAFATADGWITVGASNEQTWQRLPAAVGKPELLDDPRFALNKDRMTNHDALIAELSVAFSKHTTEHWLACLTDAGVPAGPVLNIVDMLAHPQTKARDMVVETEHRRVGRVPTLGFPIKFSRSEPAVRSAAPALGEDTQAVLRELGYDDAAIEALRDAGTVR